MPQRLEGFLYKFHDFDSPKTTSLLTTILENYHTIYVPLYLHSHLARHILYFSHKTYFLKWCTDSLASLQIFSCVTYLSEMWDICLTHSLTTSHLYDNTFLENFSHIACFIPCSLQSHSLFLTLHFMAGCMLWPVVFWLYLRCKNHRIPLM